MSESQSPDAIGEQMQNLNLNNGGVSSAPNTSSAPVASGAKDGAPAEGQEGMGYNGGNASNGGMYNGGGMRRGGRGGRGGYGGYGMQGMGGPNMRGGFMGYGRGRGGPRLPMGMFPGAGMPQMAPQEISTTNVYLKGLRSDTTDQFLRDLCKSYGPIKSAKAIIDRATQQCRGYGFVMFESPESAQAALTGLQQAGYQVDFARVTNNERAHRPEQDLTNLYFSNLPPTFSEDNLQALLQPFGEVGSCRILRDYYTGVSRGVGFARMNNTAICEHIIQEFNGKMLDGATEPLQVKFADNPRNKTKQFSGRGAFNMRMASGQFNMIYPGLMGGMGFQDAAQGGPRVARMTGGLPPVQMGAASYQAGPAAPMYMAQPQFVVNALPFPIAGDVGEATERADEFYMYPTQ
jgi:hypothetical protein